jgi:hypothetical protein
MKLDGLLKEYGETLTAPIPDFAALMAESRRRKQRVWVGALAGLAAAACMAWMLWMPKTEAVRAPVEIETTPVVASVPAPALAPVLAPKLRAVKRTAPVVREESDFVAIAETRMLPQPQSYQVLRVSVSGQRLMALGVLRPNQLMRPTMTADVLLGDDGMARAVRVVGNEYE